MVLHFAFDVDDFSRDFLDIIAGMLRDFSFPGGKKPESICIHYAYAKGLGSEAFGVGKQCEAYFSEKGISVTLMSKSYQSIKNFRMDLSWLYLVKEDSLLKKAIEAQGGVHHQMENAFEQCFLGAHPGKQLPANQVIIQEKPLAEGEGGFFDFYAGMFGEPNSQTPVTVKKPKKELGSTDDETAKTFCREARLLAQLSHANIVNLMGVCWMGLPHLVFGNQGRPLSEIAIEDGESSDKNPDAEVRLTVAAVTRIAVQMFEALRYLEERRLVLMDLSPATVLTGPKDDLAQVRLGDLSSIRTTTYLLALAAEPNSTFSGGLPHFTQPERRYNAVPKKKDILQKGPVFAAARTLYWLLVNNPNLFVGSYAYATGTASLPKALQTPHIKAAMQSRLMSAICDGMQSSAIERSTVSEMRTSLGAALKTL